MFIIYSGIILTLISYAVSHKEYPPISKSCNLGDVAENECNKCNCTQNHIFECNSKPCNETGLLNTTQKLICQPNMLYTRNSTVCLCSENGSWPHERCKTVFKSFPINAYENCEPNSYVFIDCNVCKCGADGIIDKKHCTKNECTKIIITNGTRRFIEQNQVYGSCEARNWYSLAPCQFCFCISENKLVCNTGNNYAKRLQLGSYNLSVCGTDLVRDAIGLIPDKEKALRFGEKFVEMDMKTETSVTDSTTEKYRDRAPTIELNREINEKANEQQYKKQNDSEEYYSESEESKVPMPIGRDGSSTKLPYEEDENNDVSEDKKSAESDSEISVAIPLNLQPPKQSVRESLAPTVSVIEKYPQHFEWNNAPPGEEEQPSEAFNLGDVLKPYLPVVLDKVFQMALRKSMVSVDNHANCTPGATTVFKCNACFCMKNNKLLCTSNECKS